MSCIPNDTPSLSFISIAQVAHTLLVIQTMVDMYFNESVVMGLEPVNEPWQFTPIDWLKVCAGLLYCCRQPERPTRRTPAYC